MKIKKSPRIIMVIIVIVSHDQKTIPTGNTSSQI